MFRWAYGNYMEHAYPSDELQPVSCIGRGKEQNRGTLDDAFGNFSLTLLDALDTLLVLGDTDEFEAALFKIVDNARFDNDVEVTIFEVTIRGLGGLLSAHCLASDPTVHQFKDRQYNGELLEMAVFLAERLMPAFKTATGIPFSRVNLKHGIGSDPLLETCTAGAGTLTLEFILLSRLTGNPVYEEAVRTNLRALFGLRSHLGLFGNTLNVMTGKWVRTESGIGAGIDSFFEYLFKAYVLFGDTEFLGMFNEAYEAVMEHIKFDPWYLSVDMHTGKAAVPWIDALAAFWPGLQTLKGDVEEGARSHSLFYGLWRRYGLMPEGFNVVSKTLHPPSRHYPLRPELIESTYLLYRATRDPYYLEVGRSILHSLQNRTRVRCGYAAVADVEQPASGHLDRMDSFFLSETLKYLYLLFDDANWIHAAGRNYVFTTEGHLLPVARETMSPSTMMAGDAVEPRECVLPPVLLYAHDEDYTRLVDENVGLREPTTPAQPAKGTEVPSAPVIDTNSLTIVDTDDHGNMRVTVKRVLPHNINLRPNPAGYGYELMMIDAENVLGKILIMHTNPTDIGTCQDTSRVAVSTVLGGVEKEFLAAPALFGPLLTYRGVTAQLVLAEPRFGCMPPAERLDGKIVLVERGTCLFLEKILNAQRAGAIAVIVANDKDGETAFSMVAETSAAGVAVPALMVSGHDGRFLTREVSRRPELNVTMFAVAEQHPEVDELANMRVMFNNQPITNILIRHPNAPLPRPPRKEEPPEWCPI